MKTAHIPALLLVVVVAACASQEAREPETTAPVAEVKEVQKTWAQMEGKEKGAFMKEVVVPTMGALLTAHDPEEFAEVNCGTCHGKDPRASHFEMPSPDLPQLDPTDNFAKEAAKNPEMMRFMDEQFLPKMVELLGAERMSAENPTGFGCMSCHTMKGAPAATPSDDDGAAE